MGKERNPERSLAPDGRSGRPSWSDGRFTARVKRKWGRGQLNPRAVPGLGGCRLEAGATKKTRDAGGRRRYKMSRLKDVAEADGVRDRWCARRRPDGNRALCRWR